MDKNPRHQPVKVAALYRFARPDRFAELREPLAQLCCIQGIKGTVLRACEGINGTVAGSDEAIATLIEWLEAFPELRGMELKFSTAQSMPFYRMKVRLKREIVTMGVDGIDPTKHAGTYVDAQDWNALIADPETVVIDTRNDYEVGLGTFRNAIDPETTSFSEFPAWVEANRSMLEGRKVAMFCTGGIRCEKATAYVRSLGIEDVFHLKGGILKYLEDVPVEQSLWQGECFVFDERVSVGHGLAVGAAELCRACRRPLTAKDRTAPQYREGISCAACFDERSEADRNRYAERHKQVEIAARRGAAHIGG